MRDLKIKITGSGDKYMIAQALNELAAVIKSTPTKKLEEGVEWVDGILMIKISEDDIKYPTNMTKAEAIEAMKYGRKVRHTYFDYNEWASMELGRIVLEDGVTCDPDEFWRYRTDPMFDNGWSIVNS